MSRKTTMCSNFSQRQYGLDVLVNNACVYSFGSLESITETEFHRQYDTNVLGTLLATQEAVKLFGEKGGSIINIGTAGTQNPGPGMALYLSTRGCQAPMEGTYPASGSERAN